MVGDFGNNNKKGIIPRTFEYLFNKIQIIQNKENSSFFEISIAFIQIYLEKVEDLLNMSNKAKIRENPEKGFYLENINWIKVTNIEESKNVFKIGEKNRITEFTNMNKNSSRSHALLMINIEQYFIEGNDNMHLIKKGVLNLVDLAGSERVKKSDLNNLRLEEAKNINKSLLALGNCIQKLSNNEKHIPYRDSKLTLILKESLGGNAKTSLIVTISPSNYNAEESLSSLNFGSRAMKVKNKPIINMNEDYQTICIQLQEENNKLKEKYLKLKKKYKKVCEENKKLKNISNEEEEEEDAEDEDKNFNEKIENMPDKFREYEEIYKEFKKREEEKIRELEEIQKIIKKKEEEINKLNEELNNLNSYNTNLNEENEDLKKEIENMKEINENILLEKEELNNKIISLNEINLKNNYNLEEKTKNLLSNHNIETNSVNNQNINIILNKLINDIEQKTKEDNYNKEQIKTLKKYLDEKDNNYQERTKILEIEISKKYENKLKNLEDINKNYIEQMNNKEKEYNKIYTDNVNYKNKIIKMKNDNNKLENNILILKENNIKLNKEIDELKEKNLKIENEYLSKIKTIEIKKSNLEKYKKEYENKLSELKKDSKIININGYLKDSELKRINSSININAKLLNKSINILINNKNIFNAFKKEFKKMEIIQENVNLSLTSDTYEKTIKRAKEQMNKIQSMIENIMSINNNNNILYKNYNMQDNLNQLNELIEENIEYMIINYKLLYKLFNILIDNYKINKKVNFYDDKSLESNIDKNEENMKFNIIDLIINNIDNFKPICFNTDNSDLKEDLYLLKQNCNKFSILDILKKSTQILKEIISRSANFRYQKELEINNLNQKIIYFLKEIDNYKKFVNSNKNNNEEKKLLYSEIILKDGEIIRLNKEIDSYLSQINKIMNENENEEIDKNIEKYQKNIDMYKKKLKELEK